MSVDALAAEALLSEVKRRNRQFFAYAEAIGAWRSRIDLSGKFPTVWIGRDGREAGYRVNPDLSLEKLFDNRPPR